MEQKTFYLTTTLPYVNARLHVGHALEFVRADAIARYKMLMGYDVFFNSGTDEHGMKIYQKAIELDQDPQTFVNEAFETFKTQVASFGITNKIHFIRTTDEHHIKSAQEFWRRVEKNGYIYKKNYQAKYCAGCELVRTDSELIDGHCPEHPDRELELINEENYFFKYSAFEKPLLEFYEKHPDFVIPDFRFNEIKAFVERGLEDFSISRLKSRMPWGIEVPGDPDQVMYVWFDALTNYINTLGWPSEDGDFKTYWINGTPTQYCGKDNNRFQSAMWQAMLMAAGIPNSHQIVINGHIVAEGGIKMSKSLGNVIDPFEIASEYGTEALRFFLLSEIGFDDSPFTIERFTNAYNAKLANGLGNLTSRIMKMATTHLVAPPEIFEKSIPDDWISHMERFDLKAAMDTTFSHVRALDEVIQGTEPFKLVKTDKEAAVKIISDLIVRLYTIGEMLEPMLPETSKKIKETITNFQMPEPLFLRRD